MKADRDFNLAINLLALCQLSYKVCVWVLTRHIFYLKKNNPDKCSLVYYIRLFLINRLSQQTDINCKGT